MTLRLPLNLVFGVAFVLVAGDALITYHQFSELNRLRRNRDDSAAFVNDLQRVQALARLEESWVRGALLKSQRVDELPFKQAKKDLDEAYKRLLEFVHDDPNQSQRLFELRSEMNSAEAHLDKIIAALNKQGFEPANNAFQTQDGERAMARVDDLIETRLKQEVNGLNLNSIRISRGVERLTTTMVVSTLLGLSLLVGSWYLVRLEISDRQVATDVIREARDAAERASLSKNRILAILSHELRTPLTPILISVTTLLERKEYPQLEATLEMIRRNVETEARLIDDLLDIALIEAGRLQLRRESIDAHAIILEAVDNCHSEVEGAGLELVVQLNAIHHHLRADPTRLKQIVWNLVRNAAKFTGRGGKILIRSHEVAESDGCWRFILDVEDSGIGLATNDIKRIFKTFEQVDLPSGSRGGLGLGLTIARSLAEAHGGSLQVSSQGRNRGSTFTLTMPDATSALAGVSEGREATGPSTDLNILLVEDNRDTLLCLEMMLGDLGATVRTAASVAEAMAKAENWSFDLLLSDIQLPDGSGLDIMRKFELRGIVGLAMSGFGSEEDQALSLEAGFSEHLTKPLTRDMIDQAIKRLLTPGLADRGRPERADHSDFIEIGRASNPRFGNRA